MPIGPQPMHRTEVPIHIIFPGPPPFSPPEAEYLHQSQQQQTNTELHLPPIHHPPNNLLPHPHIPPTTPKTPPPPPSTPSPLAPCRGSRRPHRGSASWPRRSNWPLRTNCGKQWWRKQRAPVRHEGQRQRQPQGSSWTVVGRMRWWRRG